MEKSKNKLKIITNGLFNENPVLRIVIGTCPTLAISVNTLNGIGMGLAATFVLICSNIAISALRKTIPEKVRMPAYITLIAGFVTVLQMLLQAFIPTLYDALGIYLPLIVVNCIILGRAEMFASKNPVFDSALDGLGMGLGFTLTLFVMGSIRELLGSGTWLNMRVIPEEYAVKILVMSPGGFFVFGVVMATLTAILAKKHIKLIKNDKGCAACSQCAVCPDSTEENK